MKQAQHTILRSLPELERLIQASLQRSAGYGLNPHTDGASESTRLNEAQLKNRIQNQHTFFSHARVQLDCLYALLRGTGFCMALADTDGYVLYVVGDADLMQHFTRRRCTPGYRWTERDMGTCAIGLVLEEKVPVFLPGDRMYAAQAQNISNAGAPVFATDGHTVLGVISLSGPSDTMHLHTLGLVRQSAETVTSHLREQERTHELAIKNQYLRALLESDSRGMVTVDPAGNIVQTNRRAQTLLNLPPKHENSSFEEAIGENFNICERLRKGCGFRAREILPRNTGCTHFASLVPIRMDKGMNKGEVVGGLFTILEKKETMRMAVEMTGTHAHFTFASIVGGSSPLQKALHLAHISAGNSAPVLLLGETGTGKELFAQAIHNESDRKNKPFVAINCGAIPKELLESELFGYEEGAFTGAQRGGRPGKFELADSGTLFLDEIGDMPFDMQVKILRVLQSGELQRIGSARSIPVDLRIISATHHDLKDAIAQQKFRADLYYRISTLAITVPPLRDRPEDILPLTLHFIQRHEQRLHRPAPLPPQTATFLQEHNWPGNIRQLESAVERAVYLAEGGQLLAEHFGLASVGGESTKAKPFSPPTTSQDNLEDIALQAVRNTLALCNGNICQAARQLGISRPTLYRKLRKLQTNNR